MRVLPYLTEGEKTKQIEFDPSDSVFHEKQLLRVVILYGNEIVEIHEHNDDTNEDEIIITSISKYFVKEIDRDDCKFHLPVYQKIFDIIKEKVNVNEPISEKDLINSYDSEISTEVINIITSPYELSENWKKHKIYIETETADLSKTAVTTLASLKVKCLMQRTKTLEAKLKESTDYAEQRIIMMQLDALRKTKIKLDKELDRIFSY